MYSYALPLSPYSEQFNCCFVTDAYKYGRCFVPAVTRTLASVKVDRTTVATSPTMRLKGPLKDDGSLDYMMTVLYASERS